MILLVGAVAAFFLASVFPFEWLAGASVLVACVTGIAIPVGGFNMRPDMAVTAVAVLAAVLRGELHRFRDGLRHPVVHWLAGFVALNFFATALFGADPRKDFAVAVWLLLDLVAVLVAVAAFGDRPERLRRLLYVGTFAIVVSADVEFLLAKATGSTTGVQVTNQFGARAQGLALEPNILAGMAALWVVILLTRERRTTLDNWFIALGLVTIWITQTRAALGAVLIGWVIYSFTTRERTGLRTAANLALTIPGAAFVVALVAGAGSSNGLGKFANLGGQTTSLRTTYWSEAINDMHGWSWVFGLGSNSFGDRHYDPTTIYQPVLLPGHLGNLPLEAVYDSGVLGALCLATAAVVIVRRSRMPKGRSAALIAAFVIVSIGTSPFFYAYFWLLIAAAITWRPSGAREALDEPAGVAHHDPPVDRDLAGEHVPISFAR